MIEPDDIYTLDGVINNLIEIAMHNLSTSIPCVVESFNEDGTVNATPSIMKVDLDDVESKYPTLSNIPIVYPGSGLFRITFPISKGDEGILIFADKEIGQFIEKGEISRPIMFRKHHISDAVFIPAMVSKGKRNNVLQQDGLVIEEIGGTAKIEIINGKINLYGSINFESIPGSGTADIELNTHVHASNGTPPVNGGGGGGVPN